VSARSKRLKRGELVMTRPGKCSSVIAYLPDEWNGDVSIRSHKNHVYVGGGTIAIIVRKVSHNLYGDGTNGPNKMLVEVLIEDKLYHMETRYLRRPYREKYAIFKD